MGETFVVPGIGPDGGLSGKIEEMEERYNWGDVAIKLNVPFTIEKQVGDHEPEPLQRKDFRPNAYDMIGHLLEMDELDKYRAGLQIDSSFQNHDWFKRLGEPAQQDTAYLIQTLQKWAWGDFARPGDFGMSHAKQHVEDLRTHAFDNLYFHALYAVGSVITGKENPPDIDLLLVTNLFPDSVYGVQPKFYDLIAKLEETHAVDVDDELTERYDNESGCRIKIDLQRKGVKTLPVDLMYQYDIVSPKHWQANDKFPALRIFSIGARNPKGYDGGLTGGLRDGAEGVPSEIYRLSHAKKQGY